MESSWKFLFSVINFAIACRIEAVPSCLVRGDSYLPGKLLFCRTFVTQLLWFVEENEFQATRSTVDIQSVNWDSRVERKEAIEGVYLCESEIVSLKVKFSQKFCKPTHFKNPIKTRKTLQKSHKNWIFHHFYQNLILAQIQIQTWTKNYIELSLKPRRTIENFVFYPPSVS